MKTCLLWGALALAVAVAGCDGRGAVPFLDAGPGGTFDAGPTPPPGTDAGARPDPCGDGRLSCEGTCVDVTANLSHCGACGARCASGEVCADGRCAQPPDHCPADGCPAGSYCDLAADRCVAGCLSDAACDDTTTCTDRSCASCPPMRGNCDRAADDGCETDLANDDASCGACGRVCPSGRTCRAGACACAGGTTDCGGACIDTTDALDHCGACGNRCEEPANGRATCAGGACGVICDRGYHACDGRCVPDDVVATCGGSCSPCSEPAHSTATCDGTECGYTCDSGYTECAEGCCERCETTGCTGLTWCDPSTGRCEAGCTEHDQCAAAEFCWLARHECWRTADSSCPPEYRYRGRCSSGSSICTHGSLPAGTEEVFAGECPAGTTHRGGYYCSDITRICIPD